MDTTHLLENQVEHLDTEENINGEVYVKKDEVVDLIRGYEEDLYSMSRTRALTEAHDILYDEYHEMNDQLWELQQEREEDPFVDLMFGDVFDSVNEMGEMYLNDLEETMDLLTILIEEEQLE